PARNAGTAAPGTHMRRSTRQTAGRATGSSETGSGSSRGSFLLIDRPSEWTGFPWAAMKDNHGKRHGGRGKAVRQLSGVDRLSKLPADEWNDPEAPRSIDDGQRTLRRPRS